MKGTLCHELEVQLPASEVWQVYGTIRLAELVVELLPNIISKIDIEVGDGGVGTVLHLTFGPDVPGATSYKEKFAKIDNEKRVKETVVVEGGYLNFGFSSYLVRFEIMEKTNVSASIKSTIEYEIDDEHAAIASSVTTGPLAAIAEAIAKYLLEKKANG